MGGTTFGKSFQGSEAEEERAFGHGSLVAESEIPKAIEVVGRGASWAVNDPQVFVSAAFGHGLQEPGTQGVGAMRRPCEECASARSA